MSILFIKLVKTDPNINEEGLILYLIRKTHINNLKKFITNLNIFLFFTLINKY